MFCQFLLKNYESYRDETIFDMQAENLQEFFDSLILCEKSSSLLPVCVIYGPNGGGKSNLLKALSCLISIVVSPICELGSTRINPVIQQRVSYEPFLFDEVSNGEPVEFRAFFRKNQYEYSYYIALNQGTVYTESLQRKQFGGKRPAHIFDRKKQEVIPGPSLRKLNVNRMVKPHMPYLSFLAITYDIPATADAEEWFESCITHISGSVSVNPALLSVRGEKDDLLVQMMNDMDIDISGYRYDKMDDRFYLKRSIDGHEYELSLEAESEGTKKLTAILPVVITALQEGRLLVIDELDAKLHPKLLRYIIFLFNENCREFSHLFR
ncbi:MAG: AAA family ATPase, partial [Clostridia bacterium]|nr:AAA family ATPase [Clostridia bacterium]